jgi:hypothetical protein
MVTFELMCLVSKARKKLVQKAIVQLLPSVIVELLVSFITYVLFLCTNAARRK